MADNNSVGESPTSGRVLSVGISTVWWDRAVEVLKTQGLIGIVVLGLIGSIFTGSFDKVPLPVWVGLVLLGIGHPFIIKFREESTLVTRVYDDITQQNKDLATTMRSMRSMLESMSAQMAGRFPDNIVERMLTGSVANIRWEIARTILTLSRGQDRFSPAIFSSIVDGVMPSIQIEASAISTNTACVTADVFMEAVRASVGSVVEELSKLQPGVDTKGLDLHRVITFHTNVALKNLISSVVSSRGDDDRGGRV